MSAITTITRRTLPDHDGTPIEVMSGTAHIGTLTFDNKGNSKWADAPGQQPHRPMRLKRKHRR